METKPEVIPMKWHPKYHSNGDHGCPLCGKPIKGEEKRRYIHIGNGGNRILRADLPLQDGESAIYADGTVDMGDMGDMGWFAIGSTCAKKLGLEWSKELEPLHYPED